MVRYLLESQNLLREIRHITRVTMNPRIQAFALCVVTVNDEHASLRAKLCLKLRLKFWFESDWYFCNTTESGWF